MTAGPGSEDLVHGNGAAEQDRAELVAVDLLSDGGTGVAAKVGDGFQRHPVVREQRDEAMSQFSGRPVLADAGLAAQSPEGAPHVPGKQLFAVAGAEDQVGVLPQRAGLLPLAILELAMPAERVHAPFR